MKNIRKTISVPDNELATLDDAKAKIISAYGCALVSDSQAFRVGVQAILELDRATLATCVGRCPQLTPGRTPSKKREQMNAEEIQDFFKI